MTKVFAVASIALLTACGPQSGTNEPAGHERIVTLAPHLTELVFAAGAGETLVGVSAYSDHPPEAQSLPVVSDAFTVDQEQLALLAPDVLLAWKSGTPAHVVSELRAAGHVVEIIETRGLEDVAAAIERIGEITRRTAAATDIAAQFRNAISDLRAANRDKSEVSVFYQVSARPLYTISGDHYIGEIIGLCGGRNVFADVGELAPAVSVEAVVERDPEVMLAADAGDGDPFADWLRWEHLAANRFGNRFRVSADEIARPTPRLAAAATEICAALDTARSNLEPGNE